MNAPTQSWKHLVYKRRPDTVLRRVAGEYVLVPLCRTAESVERMFTLNETAGLILESLDGARILEQVVDCIIESFEVERAVAEADLREIIKDLERIGAIDKEATSPA